ncbi:MAG: hypothetical protein ACON5A_05680 [Candidatus Comchoanobacterales bacterium]
MLFERLKNYLASFVVLYWLLLAWHSPIAIHASLALFGYVSFPILTTINAILGLVISYSGFTIAQYIFSRDVTHIFLRPNLYTLGLFIICLISGYGSMCEIYHIISHLALVPSSLMTPVSILVTFSFVLFSFFIVEHNFSQRDSFSSTPFYVLFISICCSLVTSLSTFWLISFAIYGQAFLCPVPFNPIIALGIVTLRFVVSLIGESIHTYKHTKSDIHQPFLLYGLVNIVIRSIDSILSDLLLTLHVAAEAGVQTKGVMNDNKYKLLSSIIVNNRARSIFMLITCGVNEYIFDFTESDNDHHHTHKLSDTDFRRQELLMLRLCLNAALTAFMPALGISSLFMSLIFKPTGSLNAEDWSKLLLPFIIALLAWPIYATSGGLGSFIMCSLLSALSLQLLPSNQHFSIPFSGIKETLKSNFDFKRLFKCTMIAGFSIILAIIGSYELVEAFSLPLPLVIFLAVSGFVVEYTVYAQMYFAGSPKAKKSEKLPIALNHTPKETTLSSDFARSNPINSDHKIGHIDSCNHEGISVKRIIDVFF